MASINTLRIVNNDNDFYRSKDFRVINTEQEYNKIVIERKRGAYISTDTLNDFYRCLRMNAQDSDVCITMKRVDGQFCLLNRTELFTEIEHWKGLHLVSHDYNIGEFEFAGKKFYTFVIQNSKWTEEDAPMCPLLALTGVMVSGFTYIVADRFFAEMVCKELAEQSCILCFKKFQGHGHNPSPCAEEGRCCERCNAVRVMPARMKHLDDVPEIRKIMHTNTKGGHWKAYETCVKEYNDKKNEEDAKIALEIKKMRKEAEQKAKEEAEEKARKEAREQKKRERNEVKASGVSIAELTASKGKEDDEAKEIRRRAKEVKVKVKTKNGGK